MKVILDPMGNVALMFDNDEQPLVIAILEAIGAVYTANKLDFDQAIADIVRGESSVQ